MFYCFPGPLFRKKMSLEHPTARWSSVTSILHTFWLKNITFAQWFRLFSNVVSASSRCFFSQKKSSTKRKKNHGPWKLPEVAPPSVQSPHDLPERLPSRGRRSSGFDEKNSWWVKKMWKVKGVNSQWFSMYGFFLTYIWVFPKIGGTAKLSSLIGFSIVNHRFWGTPIFGNTHLGSFG